MGKQDPLSQLKRQRLDLRQKAERLERQLATAEITIADERIRGARLRRLLAERDRLKEQAAECSAQLDQASRDIERRENAPETPASPGVTWEIAPDGSPADSVRHLTW